MPDFSLLPILLFACLLVLAGETMRFPKVVEDGYQFQANRQLVTLFSAPNYCGEFDNAGAIMSVNDNLVCSFRVLRPASHKKFMG